ncbi:MAG TPA: hypothetical protein VMJ74_03275, partial [Pseudomonadales bacterium]|nr:hypothetical protein [Pseudomonadales bacterium]
QTPYGEAQLSDDMPRPSIGAFAPRLYSRFNDRAQHVSARLIVPLHCRTIPEWSFAKSGRRRR